MGDMADYVMDSMNDDETLYDYGGTKACRCCGASQLHWAQQDKGKWVLVDDECCVHVCPENPLPEDF